MRFEFCGRIPRLGAHWSESKGATRDDSPDNSDDMPPKTSSSSRMAGTLSQSLVHSAKLKTKRHAVLTLPKRPFFPQGSARLRPSKMRTRRKQPRRACEASG